MNKIEALNYIADNVKYWDEWTGAGLAEIFIEVIKSEDTLFSVEYLDALIEKAEHR